MSFIGASLTVQTSIGCNRYQFRVLYKNESLSNKYIITCLSAINDRKYGKRRPNNRLSYEKFEELHGFIIAVLWKVLKMHF